jgi:hypothetical protein
MKSEHKTPGEVLIAKAIGSMTEAVRALREAKLAFYETSDAFKAMQNPSSLRAARNWNAKGALLQKVLEDLIRDVPL